MEYWTKGIGYVSAALVAWGSVWAIWGIVKIASGLNEHSGAEMKEGLSRLIGGVLVYVAAGLLVGVKLVFS